MRKVPVLAPAEAAALIPDGAVVSVSSSSALGCPDAVLRGIDHLARPGLLARVVAGSYPSGPSSAEPPLIWQMIVRGEVEAYNLPSGVLFQMHRAAASRQPGVLTAVGLDTFVDPRREGGRMNDRTTEDIVHVEQRDGQDWLFYPAMRPDVSIIRGTTA